MAYADVGVTGGRGALGTPLLAGTLCLLGAGLVVEVAVGASNPFLPVILVISTLYACLGAAVARRRPGHPVGIVLLCSGLVGALTVTTGAHVDAALAGALPHTGLAWSLWLNRWLWVLIAATPVALLFAFPDGRLPSPGWRSAAAAAAGLVGVFLVQAMGQPFRESFWRDVPVTNPLGPAAADLSSGLGPWPALGLVLANACGAAAVLVRRHRATGDVRQRLRWVAPSAVAMPVALAVSFFGGAEWAGIVEMLAGLALAVAVTVATFRYRMYDADLALHRGVIYGLLVAGLVGAYVAVVVVVSSAVPVSWLPGAVGAAVVAVAFGPLLNLLQRRADELLFGARRSPERVARLILDSGSVDPDIGDEAAEPATLQRAVTDLRAALRLPWVSLEAGGLVVGSGEPRTTGVPVPLRRGDQEVGRLMVGRRYDDERLGPEDPALAAAAAQLALTVGALLTARDLRRARDRLVRARAEERRRIRRDLHDGLGPTLAGVTLGLEGAADLAERDPASAVTVLPELRDHARKAVADLRELVDGLRPSELDHGGLATALRARLALLSPGGTPELRLHMPDSFAGIADDVEVAAYRICLEAVTNVVRHADARTCEVAVEMDGDRLRVSIEDDGQGIGDAEPHVGLHSMAERTAEVGGHLEITARDAGGTRVQATLPLASGVSR